MATRKSVVVNKKNWFHISHKIKFVHFTISQPSESILKCLITVHKNSPCNQPPNIISRNRNTDHDIFLILIFQITVVGLRMSATHVFWMLFSSRGRRARQSVAGCTTSSPRTEKRATCATISHSPYSKYSMVIKSIDQSASWHYNDCISNNEPSRLSFDGSLCIQP